MKRILCYGDSNTWGAIPGTANGRYCERYPKILQKLLGQNYEVVEEGLRARTVCVDDIQQPKGNRNGALFFAQSVYSHDPLDFVVILLGTNDLKNKFNKTPKMCANELEEYYIKVINGELGKQLIQKPRIVIVAPGEIKEGLFNGFENAEEKSKSFNNEYKKVANKNACIFIDNKILQAGCDGIHLTQESHKKLAEKLANVIK